MSNIPSEVVSTASIEADITINQADIDTNANNIGILAIRSQIDNSNSIFNLDKAVSDEYEDETGVDGTASLNETYNSSGDYYTNSSAYGAFTTLLAHMDGTDDAQVFTDSSSSGHTITANGDAKTENTEKKFGVTSAGLDGTGDYLGVADSSDWDFGTGAFVFDCWFFAASGGAGQLYLFDTRIPTDIKDAELIAGIYDYTDSKIHTKVGNIESTASSTTTQDAWHHFALVVDASGGGSNVNAYVDGTKLITATQTFNYVAIEDWKIGAAVNATGPWKGYIDEFRVLTGSNGGITGNFTPETSAYSLAALDMTLISESTTAAVAPTAGRVVIVHKPVDATTLDTDFIAYLSMDNGSTYTTLSLTNIGEYSTGVNILVSGKTTLTSTSGVTLVVKSVTANAKEQQVWATYFMYGA